MHKKIMIRTLDQDGQNEEIAELNFTEEEWESLEDFSRYASELRESSLVKEGIPTSLNVAWKEGEGLKVETKLPSNEQIDAMLMKLRPMILQKEPTEFTKLRNYAWKATGSKRVRKHLDTLLYLYTGRRLQAVFVFGASSPKYPKGAVINSEFMLDCWLNGHRFHKDKDKQRILDEMHGIMPPESSVALLLFLIADKITAILAFQRLVSLLAGNEQEIFTGASRFCVGSA